MIEQAIQTKIIKALRERGAFVMKIMAAGEAGVPDLVACYEGRFVALEVKQPGKYPTRLQRHRIAQIRMAGGTAEVVRSVEDALLAVGMTP